MKKNNQIIFLIFIILSFIVALYCIISFQWGILFSFIFLIVPVILILMILQKLLKQLEISNELNLNLASDIESLKVSVNKIKEDIGEIKEIAKKE